jgi:hypothetical protein
MPVQNHPNISTVVFDDGKMYRGRNKQLGGRASTGWIKGGGGIMPNWQNLQNANAILQSTNYWVIIQNKAGTVCWTGTLTFVDGSNTQDDPLKWHFSVEPIVNDEPADPGQGDETVTITVVNPDSGPSNPAPKGTNVVVE